MGIGAAILGVIGQIAPGIAKSIFPNPEDELKRQELEQRLPLAILQHSATLDAAAADIIKTEAASSHWLAANWRPITALTFVALIVARFLGYTAPGITEAEYLKLWGIMEVMIGGYTLI